MERAGINTAGIRKTQKKTLHQAGFSFDRTIKSVPY